MGRIVGPMIGPRIVDRGIAIGSDQRFRIVRPRLVVADGQRAGAVTQMAFDRDRRFLFAVLADGGARWWDLERGLERGAVRGKGIRAGMVRGGGLTLEMIAVRADGSSLLLRVDGTRYPLSAVIPELDPAAPMAIAENGATAFRIRNGTWWIGNGDGARVMLRNAAADALPVFSSDGFRVAYRTAGGRGMRAMRLVNGKLERIGRLSGCADSAPITAAQFTPAGGRVLLGDADANLCLWDVSGGERPRLLFSVATGLDRPVRVLAMEGNGALAAVGDGRAAVELWPLTGRIERHASATLPTGAAGAFALDTERKWLLAGGADGTIAVYGYGDRDGERRFRPIARLLSTNEGWSVLDPSGRFDGSQDGIDALSWAGTAEESAAEHGLSVDSFSESHYEPGLLAKLDDTEPELLNDQARDLREEGYVRPPEVTIEIGERDPAGGLSVTVRTEPNYPAGNITGLRLYHNGKLALDGEDGTASLETRIVPIPGENLIRAVAAGPDGVEGPPATARVTAPGSPSPSRLIVVAIGINDYARPAWKLFYPRKDVEKVVSVLREKGTRLRVRSDRHAFSGVHAETLLDRSARKEAIENLLTQVSSNAQDVLVVYFAGHGYASRGEDGWDWYLLPHTRVWRRVQESTQDELIRRHGISARRLMTLLTRTAAQRVFLVLDSCYSGAVVEAVEGVAAPEPRPGDDAAGQKALRQVARIGGLHVLAASRAHETARELQVQPHGALTYLLLEGIGGLADADNDRTVSVREIIDYASAEMPNLADRLSQEPISQKPVAYSRGADFAVAGL